MIMSIEVERTFDKIQHLFMINTLNKLRIEENFFNLKKGIYMKLTVNIILNGERLNTFSLRSGTKPSCLLLLLLLKIVL